MTKKDIFHFNHIDKNISQEKMTEIKALYHTEPTQCVCNRCHFTVNVLDLPFASPIALYR